MKNNNPKIIIFVPELNKDMYKLYSDVMLSNPLVGHTDVLLIKSPLVKQYNNDTDGNIRDFAKTANEILLNLITLEDKSYIANINDSKLT